MKNKTVLYVMSRFIFLMVSIFLCFGIAQADTIYSTTQGGDWFDETTWSGGIIPGVQDDIIIEGNVNIDRDISLNNLKITQNQQLTGEYQGANTMYSLRVYGNILNNGTIAGTNIYIESPTGSQIQTIENNGILNVNIYGNTKNKINFIGNKLPGIFTLLQNTILTGTFKIAVLDLSNYSLTLDAYKIHEIDVLYGSGNIKENIFSTSSTIKISHIATNPGAYTDFNEVITSSFPSNFSGKNLVLQGSFGNYRTPLTLDFQRVTLSGGLSVGSDIHFTGDFIISEGSSLGHTSLRDYTYFNDTIQIDGNFVNHGNIDTIAQWYIYRPFGQSIDIYFYVFFKIKGDIENTGNIQSGIVGVFWDQIENYSDYIFSLTGQADILIQNTREYYFSLSQLQEQNIYWKIKGKDSTTESSWGDEKCINVSGCIEYGNHISSILPFPTNLSQSIAMPDPKDREGDGDYKIQEQAIELGEQIGKYQSGSGVILRADIENPSAKNLRLVVEIHRFGEGNIFQTYTGAYSTDAGTRSIELPYLGTGKYSWKMRIEDEDGNTSEAVDFGTEASWEYDFGLFEGFEPYPYGYRFHNANFDKTELTGGINTYFTLSYPFIYSEIRPGTKWDIFENAFDNNGFISEKQKIKAFKNSGLVNADIIAGGSCYGMSLSAIMKKEYPNYLSTYYSRFYQEIEEENIWNGISPPSYSGTGSNAYWDKYDEVDMKSILAMQLSQKGKVNRDAEKNGITDIQEIITKLKNNPDGNYIINFYGEYPSGGAFGHAVVPYKVEEKDVDGEKITRIYIGDNNFQYPFRETGDNIYYSYNQFFEIDANGNWKNNIYRLQEYTKIVLINVEDIYANNTQTIPVGFHITDIVYTLSGSSDMIVTDSFGRVSGFQDGEIFEEIPGVDVIIPLNARLDEQVQKNTFKQIYLSEKQDLKVQVIGSINEEYDLFIAGGDYYTEIVGVDILDGQIDSFISTKESIEIDFDDTKSGEYNISVDNFEDVDTESIYLSNIGISTSPQKYSIDWGKVQVNDNESIKYEIDLNLDGVYDRESYFSAIPNPHDNIGSISGYVISNPSNAGYKVCFDENKNGVCEESREEFIVTDETGYYKFSDLEAGEYTLLQEKRNNWNIVSPEGGQYEIYVNNGQNYKDLYFVNEKIQGKKNK